MACFLLFPFLRYKISVSLFLCVEFFNSQARLFCNNDGYEGENEGNFELIFMLASHPLLYIYATKRKACPRRDLNQRADLNWLKKLYCQKNNKNNNKKITKRKIMEGKMEKMKKTKKTSLKKIQMMAKRSQVNSTNSCLER